MQNSIKCDFSRSSVNYNPSGHVITRDLNIINMIISEWTPQMYITSGNHTISVGTTFLFMWKCFVVPLRKHICLYIILLIPYLSMFSFMYIVVPLLKHVLLYVKLLFSYLNTIFLVKSSWCSLTILICFCFCTNVFLYII